MANYGSAAQGALAGATGGATLGSAFPVIGTGIGAAGGALVGGLGSLFGGKGGTKDKRGQTSTLTPEQSQTLQAILGQLGLSQGAGQNYGQATDYYSQMLSGSPEAYERFAAPYRTQFQEQTLPGIAERFAGLGGGLGGGALSSSGFGQAIGGAGAQYESSLANLYAQLQQHAAQQAFSQYNGLAGLGLSTNAFQNTYQPGNTGLLANAISGFSGGISQGIGSGISSGISNRIAQAFEPKKPAVPQPDPTKPAATQ